MKREEMRVYQEIQRNARTAVMVIDTVADKVYDRDLSAYLSRQSLEYSGLQNQATEKLLECGMEPVQSNHLSEMALKSSLHYNTLLNNSTSRIAELMMKESSAGMVAMNKVLNHNEEAAESSVALAHRLLELQEGSIEHLKKFL